VRRAFRPSRRTAREHERQPPALQLVAGHGVEGWDGVREMRLGRGDTLAAEVGDLVPEHLVNGGFFQELGPGRGGCPVVEQGGQNFCDGGSQHSLEDTRFEDSSLTAVFLRFGKAAGSSAVEGVLNLLLGLNN